VSEGRVDSVYESFGSAFGDLMGSTVGTFCPSEDFGGTFAGSFILTGPDFLFALSRLILSSDISSMPSKAGFLLEPEEDLLECSSICRVSELSSICSH
jgi:hypothetical protein